MIQTSREGPERAFLVGVEFRYRSRSDRDIDLPPSALMARNAADAEEGHSNRRSRPDAEESLAVFRELAASAGAEIAGEFVQHRDRPDPATLIGKGKLQEIAGAAASAQADVILVDLSWR